jgi:UDP-glucose 4-epimerase
VREVVDAVIEVTGRAVEARPGPRRPGDPAALVAAPTAALAWRPRRGDIRTIVEDAWRWHQKRGG